MVAKTFWSVARTVALAVMAALLMVGCASTPMYPGPSKPPVSEPSKPPVVQPEEESSPTTAERDAKVPEKAPAVPVEVSPDSPAYGLLQDARAARAEGNHAAASRYLERALNVAQPAEAAVVYRELGELRLAEGENRSAEGIFMRALRDAPANNGWKAELWEKIEAVRKAQGNLEGAAVAAERAQQLRES